MKQGFYEEITGGQVMMGMSIESWYEVSGTPIKIRKDKNLHKYLE